MYQIKNLQKGGIVYALVKDEELKFLEGVAVSVGAVRAEMPNIQAGTFPTNMTARNVLDFTFNFDGKTYTETIGEGDCVFQTKQLGGIALVATDKDSILLELRSSLKDAENYLKGTETEIPRQEKRKKQCEELIATLDTAFAEKQALDARIQKLEEGALETNSLLKQVLKKLDK